MSNEAIAEMRDLHATLQGAMTALGEWHGNLPPIRTDTAFALGEAIGTLMKAKALVGRDIDDAKDAAGPET